MPWRKLEKSPTVEASGDRRRGRITVEREGRRTRIVIPVEHRAGLWLFYGAAACYFAYRLAEPAWEASAPVESPPGVLYGLVVAAHLVCMGLCAGKLAWLTFGYEYIRLSDFELVAGWRAGPVGLQRRMDRDALEDVRTMPVTGLERKVAYRDWTLGMLSAGRAGMSLRGSRSGSEILLGVGLPDDELERIVETVRAWRSEREASADARGASAGKASDEHGEDGAV